MSIFSYNATDDDRLVESYQLAFVDIVYRSMALQRTATALSITLSVRLSTRSVLSSGSVRVWRVWECRGEGGRCWLRSSRSPGMVGRGREVEEVSTEREVTANL